MKEVQEEKIEIYKRTEIYKYLHKSLSICDENPKQVENFIKEYVETIDKIEGTSVQFPVKLSSFKNMAFAKILHHFDNTRIEEQQLKELDKIYIASQVLCLGCILKQ